MSRRPLTRNLAGHARASAAALHARASAAAFRALLARPHVRPVAAASVLARLPKGMMPLATVLVLHQSTGSYAVAGIAVAATALGDAASAPAQGRLADRFGRGRVLIPSAAVHAAAVVAVLVLVHHGAPAAAVVAAACLAGIGMPPVSGSIKAAWPHLAGQAALPAAYALESLLQQVVFLAGPLLVAAITAAAAPPVPAWRSRHGPDQDKSEPDTWYVDLVEVTTGPGSVVVRDLYIDVLVPVDGRHQRLLDLDEFAGAIEAGQLDAITAVDGLRRWQRFLDRHLHAARDPSGQWTDFPPRRLRDLAALPAPLGPVVTMPD